MIFQHTHELVMRGIKTQTRRIVVQPTIRECVDGDWLWDAHQTLPETVYTAKPGKLARPKYRVGNTYAVQPGRGKKAVGRIRITGIRREDVRTISKPDIFAEGFSTKDEYLTVWCSMHDKEAASAHPDGTYLERAYMMQCLEWLAWLHSRPAERYQAWVLTFELVRD